MLYYTEANKNSSTVSLYLTNIERARAWSYRAHGVMYVLVKGAPDQIGNRVPASSSSSSDELPCFKSEVISVEEKKKYRLPCHYPCRTVDAA